MIAQVVNAIAIAIGCLIGLVFKHFFTEKISETVNFGLALCVLYIGISGALTEINNVLIVIISMALGAIIGEYIDINDKLEKFSKWIEKKLNKGNISEAFITTTLLFCVGAMAIVGSLNAGLMHDYTVIYAKSTIDFVSSILYSSSLGIGCILSSICVLIYQGLITALSSLISPLLSDAVIDYMNVTGSLVIIGLALNMLKLTKLKVANYIPAIFIPIILCLFMA